MTRHVYACPMRWADLDTLGHVNNVTYVDYLQEARVDMLRVHVRSRHTGDLAEGVVVVSNELTYLAQLTFDFEPVLVEVWVTEIRPASFTLAYEIFREREGERTVYARATSVLTPYVFAEQRPRRLTSQEREGLEGYLEPPVEDPHAPAAGRQHETPVRLELGHYPLHVRFSDVDAYGHVNNVAYFEFFQEARIACIGALRRRVGVGRYPSMVVARSLVRYRRQILFRPEPYDMYSWVERIGRTSVAMRAAILDGDELLASARHVMVFVDLAAGRSVEPPAEVRALLHELTPAEAGR